MQLGPFLKNLRKDKKMTQIQLSQAVGISKSYISFLESGERHPSRDVVLKLAHILCEHQGQTRDKLLVLAGFSPENQDYLDLDIPRSMITSENFNVYLRYILHLVKQGQFQHAQTKIEEGFERFRKPAQMQTLLAHLELSKGHFEHAIIAQKAAIEQYDLLPEEQVTGLSLADFHANLGVMFFLKGDEALFKKIEAESLADLTLVDKFRSAALKAYTTASESIQASLKIEPEQLYFWDEYGRLQFNLADLMNETDSEPYWIEAINAFQKVLAHPDKHSLKSSHLLETSAFLAQALVKNKRFKESKLILDLLSTFFQKSALVFYIQACHYALLPGGPSDSELSLGLDCLQRAWDLDVDSQFWVQAQYDKDRDLKVLYTHAPHIFEAEVVS